MVKSVLHLFAWLVLVVVYASPLEAQSPQQLNERGVALMQQGEFEAALVPLRKAVSAMPNNSVIRNNLAHCYLGLGMSHLQQSNFAEAAQAFADGREYKASDERFWLYRGLALMRQGAYYAAQDELEQARAIAGDGFEVFKLLGLLYYDIGRLDDAIYYWESALSFNPEDQELLERLERTRAELAVEQQMTSDVGSNFIISYDGETQAGVGSEVLDVLQQAYSDIGYEFNSYPNVQVPVILYTRRDYSELTRSPQWAGGHYDGKIRLAVGGFTSMTAFFRSLLYHEYSHVVVHYMTQNRCPVWLDEGLAEVQGRRHYARPLTRLHRAVDQNALIPFERLAAPFVGLSNPQVELAYQQSYSFVAYLIDTLGMHRMVDLLHELGQGTPLEAALDRVTGGYPFDFQSLQQKWRGSL